MTTFKWTVEFTVAECWIADGFNLTAERALEMMASDLGYANTGTELGARIIKAPKLSALLKAQGFSN